jgi:hypothetical protein
VPQFKVKDLMINVVPEALERENIYKLCPQGTFCWPDTNWCPTWFSHCHWYSPIGCQTWISRCDWGTIVACHRFISDCPGGTILCRFDSGICPNASQICPGGSIVCQTGSDPCGGSILDPGDILTNPAALSALKEQLRQTLARVEAQEQAAAEGLQPQTIEQVDQLTQQLTEGLEELKARRQELEKRGTTKQ